jgi:hypothetical protein
MNQLDYAVSDRSIPAFTTSHAKRVWLPGVAGKMKTRSRRSRLEDERRVMSHNVPTPPGTHRPPDKNDPGGPTEEPKPGRETEKTPEPLMPNPPGRDEPEDDRQPPRTRST